MSASPASVEIWIDGCLTPQESATVSVLDRAFLYGDSIFETMRTYGHRPFALEAHMARLAQSARRVLIRLPLSEEELAAEVRRAVEKSSYEECYVRVMVTRGVGALGLDPRKAVHPKRVMLLAPLTPPPIKDYREGIKTITFETSRIADATPAAGAKVGNYLVAVLATEKANQAGAKEALIMTRNGEITEGATSNLFWLEGGCLWTPSVEAGILEGITRRHILAAAESLGIEVKNRIPQKQDLLSSEGVFISSSIRELMPVVSIDERPVAGGKVPALVSRLHARFRHDAGAPALDLSV